MTDKVSVFTKIINREIPADIVFENERIIVIHDIKKDAPVHLLAITKHPYKNIDELVCTGDNAKDLLWELFEVLTDCAKQFKIQKSGYRILANNGPDAHQIVPHLHVHLLGGERLQLQDPTEP